MSATVAAIVLAAGGAARFGSPKALACFRGKTLVRATVDCAVAAGCAPVLVVVGDAGPAIEREIRPAGAAVVANPEWATGPGSSIRTGVEHALRTASGTAPAGFLLLACDQPLLGPEIIRSLLDAFDGSPGRMVAAAYAGTVGVPALFEASLGADLLALPPGCGAKALLARDSGRLVRVPWAGGAEDVDRPEDLARLEARYPL